MICKFVGNSRQTRASAHVHDRFVAFDFVRDARGAAEAAAGAAAAGAAAAGGAAAGAAAGAGFGAWACPSDGYAVAIIVTHAIAAPNRLMIALPLGLKPAVHSRYRKKKPLTLPSLTTSCTSLSSPPSLNSIFHR